MKNRYLPLTLALIVFLGVMLTNAFVRTASRRPELMHYIVAVSPTISNDKLQIARIALEESIFRSVNTLSAQDSNLTASEALDSVLPMQEKAASVPGGAVLVIKNYGRATTHNIQVTLTLGLPLEQYKIFPSETAAILAEDKANGKLQLQVEKLAAEEKVQVVFLFSGKHDVFLTASRTEDLDPPVLVTTEISSMQQVQTLATQTAVAIYNQNNMEGLLQFTVEDSLDRIPFTIAVSSDEEQSDFYETRTDTEEERRLFFETFAP